MIDTTILASLWGLVATAASGILYLSRRMTLEEIDEIIQMVKDARDELSEGGKDITVDEALAILDRIIKALES